MRALIVVIVALLSAPAFGDGKLAVDLGFGGLKPTQAERFDPNVPSEEPPLPRARPPHFNPEWEERIAEGDVPEGFQRYIDDLTKEKMKDPEFRRRVEENVKRMLEADRRENEVEI